MSGAPAPTVIRAPNHLGDVVAALPAILEDGSDVLVVRSLAPVLEMAGVRGEVIPFDRGFAGFQAAAAELRRRGYRRGVLLTAAFSAAWLFAWGRVRERVGTATDGRSLLLTGRVPLSALRPHHRINAYRLLLGQPTDRPPTGVRLRADPELVGRWRERTSGAGPVVGLFPGANAPARRWPVERFAEVAAEAARRGCSVVVMGGPLEAVLTGRVAAAAPGALDAGGRTDLRELAALLSVCEVVVTNDTGPMHLAGAVGTRTVSLWGSSDPEEVAQVGSPDTRVSGADLPCRPCRRNRCRRSGSGTVLADAHEECMRLLEVGRVLDALWTTLDEEGRA